jgi:dCTP deaminase
VLGSDAIQQEMRGNDPLVISPTPEADDYGRGGSASVDLRLGTWFSAFRLGRTHLLEIERKVAAPSVAEAKIAKMHYVALGDRYILHPGQFVLGVTLQWIRMPAHLGAYVIGKSSWGRRGLVIATATVVHPGFTGSLTMELANVGEVPLELVPGTGICQFCLHRIEGGPRVAGAQAPVSSFVGHRRPMVGRVVFDRVAEDLADASSAERADASPAVRRLPRNTSAS